MDNPTILLGTVLLEANRWTPEKRPTLKISEWADAILAAGFSGLELWENHAALADPAEQAALRCMPIPVSIFSSYCKFDDDGAAGRRRTAEWARAYGVSGVKFNLGPDVAMTETYMRNLAAWLDMLPEGCRALCECHGGTVLEETARAVTMLRPVLDRIGIIVHAFAGDDDDVLRRWIDACGNAINHVHVASEFRPNVGCVPLREIGETVRRRIGLLREAGFAGTWTIEFTAGVALPPEDPAKLLNSAAADRQFLCKVLTC